MHLSVVTIAICAMTFIDLAASVAQAFIEWLRYNGGALQSPRHAGYRSDPGS